MPNEEIKERKEAQCVEIEHLKDAMLMQRASMLLSDAHYRVVFYNAVLRDSDETSESQYVFISDTNFLFGLNFHPLGDKRTIQWIKDNGLIEPFDPTEPEAGYYNLSAKGKKFAALPALKMYMMMEEISVLAVDYEKISKRTNPETTWPMK